MNPNEPVSSPSGLELSPNEPVSCQNERLSRNSLFLSGSDLSGYDPGAPTRATRATPGVKTFVYIDRDVYVYV